MKTDRTARPAGNGSESDVVYGIHAVEEALRAGSRHFQRLILVRRDRRFSRILQYAQERHIPLFIEPSERLTRLIGQGHHQGVAAVVAAKSYSEESQLLAHAWEQAEPPFFVILDGVEDPQNLGAVIRTAEGAGVHGVFIPQRRAVGITAGVARASAGAVEYMQVAQVVNIGKLIQRMSEEGIDTYALDPASEKSYTDLDLTTPVALVFGAEDHGIRPGVLGKCADRARITMKGNVASLNLSASVAAVLFEARRQRDMAGRKDCPT